MVGRNGRFSALWSRLLSGRRPRPASEPGGRHRARRLRSVLGAQSAAGQVFVLQMAMVVLIIAAVVTALLLQARHQEAQAAREETEAVAASFANAPGVARALDGDDPTAVLQPRAEAARERSGMDTIVIYRPDGILLTHPDPDRIGERALGPWRKAVRGESFSETFEIPLGLAVSAAEPVRRADGSVAGAVTAEVAVERVHEGVERQLPVLLGAAGAALVLAIGGTALVSRRLRRQTQGLGPVEMTRMYQHHDAVLHAVREGVLIVRDDRRLLLANDEARRLLDLPPDAEQRRVDDLGLAPGIVELLASGRVATDEVHLVEDRLLAVNQRSVSPADGRAGSVVTLRDSTELRSLAGRAEMARERLELLYDAGVLIGTTLDVVRTAEELAEVAAPRFADYVTVELAEPVLHGEEPEGENTQMRRVVVHGIRSDHPLTPVGEVIGFLPAVRDTGLGRADSVLEPDLAHGGTRWQGLDPERARQVVGFGIHSLVSVPLQARGVVLGMADFWRSEQDPFEEDDLTFAEELAARAALSIDNARRYTREHALADTLQRSLLPRMLPEHSALEAAHRYRPAQAGVGGDWFDVIPLSGARVALVVGDVVGHGLHAAATMGRLRTAVHNFSALDQAPDELLGHLDELVARSDGAEPVEDEDDLGITGATCLYAIYDPVTGRATLARAGHPPPGVVHPDGTVHFPEVPVSPPLGLGGGLPVETTELQLPAGSLLVLFTDGLIETRDHDLDSGFERLREALAGHPGRSPEDTCAAVLEALLPARPADDVALLVARTRLLDPERVADWDVEPDPAAVAPLRAGVSRQLESWGLEQVAYTTELIISELVTNAIRYGTGPIRLRVVREQNSLICEVSDNSSTSPHLRRAATTDEGGRGLFLVAQITERWGTRYTARGKVIWTEQPLGGSPPAGAGEDLGDVLLDQWDDL